MLARLLIAELILAFSTNAWACLPLPLSDRVDFFNDAAAQLMTQERISLAALKAVQFSEAEVISYEWIESDSGFECHDKETLKTKVSITYLSPEKKLCRLRGTVTKTESFYSSAPKSVYQFKNVVANCPP